MKALNDTERENAVLTAYQQLVKDGAKPGHETRLRAESIVSNWSGAAPEPAVKATAPTEPEIPGLVRFTTREVRAIFLFGAGVGALGALFLMAIGFGVILAVRG